MKTINTFSAISLVSLASLSCAVAETEGTALSLEAFEGAENWDAFRPGDLEVNNEALTNLKVAYKAEFALPDGTMELVNYIDVMDVMFDGKPADWMQWTFTSEDPTSTAAANMDTLIMDQATGALRFRILPSGPGSKWGGPYNMIGASSESLKRIIFSGDEQSQVENIDVDGSVFDFGGLPFVFPFLDLSSGDAFRLHAYQQSGADGVQFLDVRVIGETKITDVHGKEHAALEIQTLAPSRTTLVKFYVTDKAPFFYGYDYKSVESGVSLFKMTYRGYVRTDIK